MQKLYKKDNTGATRVWWAEIKGNLYRLNSGQLNGAIITSEWTSCEGRNIGRSNQTSAAEQCQKEVEALYTKKKKRGYTENIKEIEAARGSLISPMLAHRYEDHSHKITFKDPVYSQPKLDGIRCIARADGLWTRKGERITSVPHIEELILPMCRKKNLIFDGELYNHDLKDDFNEIASLVRRQKQSPEHLARVCDIVQYHTYDLVDQGMCFSDRNELLNDIVEHYFYDSEEIQLVQTDKCNNQYMLDNRYEEYAADGYEGQMVRTNSRYVHKRTDSLLKRKEFQDEEFEIIGMVEGKGNRSGMVGAIIFETREGKRFQAALMGTNDYRRRIWKDHKAFVGVDATVKYFHKTPDGIPRFPVVKSIDEGK